MEPRARAPTPATIATARRGGTAPKYGRKGLPRWSSVMAVVRSATVERTAREREEGMGLGLFITKAIVEGHNGHITVQSAPGEGATFTIFIPALRV